MQTPLRPKVYFMNALTVFQIKPPHLSPSQATNLPPALLPVFFFLNWEPKPEAYMCYEQTSCLEATYQTLP